MKIKRIIISVLTLVLLLGLTCNATELEPDWDNDQHNINVNVKEVKINYNISEEFKNFDMGTLILKNSDTLETSKYTLSRMFSNFSGTIFIPPGNYEFVAFTFSRKNGIAQNYKAELLPDKFSVREDGSVSEIPTLKVSLQITTSQEEINSTLINDGDFRGGFIGISYYTISDALTKPDSKNYITRVTHSFTRNGEIQNRLLAGQSRITNVYAYDRDKKPLNVYVSPFFFTTERTLDTTRLTNSPQYIYVFHNIDELTQEQQDKIRNEGYILFSADSMDEFTRIPDNVIQVGANGEKSPTDPEIYANDIPSPYPGWQLYTKTPSGKDITPRYGFSGDAEPTQTEVKESNFNWLWILLVIPAVIFVIWLKKRNDDKEDDEEDTNKKKKRRYKEDKEEDDE